MWLWIKWADPRADGGERVEGVVAVLREMVERDVDVSALLWAQVIGLLVVLKGVSGFFGLSAVGNTLSDTLLPGDGRANPMLGRAFIFAVVVANQLVNAWLS